MDELRRRASGPGPRERPRVSQGKHRHPREDRGRPTEAPGPGANRQRQPEWSNLRGEACRDGCGCGKGQDESLKFCPECVTKRHTSCTIVHIQGRILTTRLALSRSRRDRKSTRLNSSHVRISYAVFCLKK